MSDVAQRLTELESRLRRLEDERAITRLLTAYGPLVDSGSADGVGGLWDRDGVYDVDERLMTGREEVVAMVRGEQHQRFIGGGCAHFLGPSHVTVDGEDAVAVGYSLMVVADDSGFRVRRATANHWQLRRTDAGWRVVNRTARVLDGRAEARELLAYGVSATPEPATPEPAGAGPPAPRVAATVLDRLYALQRAIDTRDWATIRATFTPDGTGYGQTGVDDVLAIMQAHLGGCGPTQHLLGNPLVAVDGDHARTRCYARVYHQGAGSRAGDHYEALGEYDDRWVLLDGEWRLQHRSFETRIHLGDFAVLQPAPE